MPIGAGGRDRDPRRRQSGAQLAALPPPRLDQLVGLRLRHPGAVGVGERPEANHQRGWEGPGLGGDVLDADNLDAGLLAGLTDHRLLERLARLDEAGQSRPPVLGGAVAAAEQAALAGG